MRKIITVLIATFILLAGCSSDLNSNESTGPKETNPALVTEEPLAGAPHTLKYWVNYPEKGIVNTLEAYRFEVKSTDTGVSITAYNSDGTKNKESSVSDLNTILNSYEISDSLGKITNKSESSAAENGLPILLLNVNNYSDYYDLVFSDDKSIKDTWFNGSYSIVENGTQSTEISLQHGNLQIKRRGNTSFELPKRPYTIKLNESKSLFGMESNKDWVLVANYSDKTLLRNYFTYTIGKKMNTAYVPDCRSIEVYFSCGNSAEYLGTYLMTEKIEVAGNKINITEMTASDSAISRVNENSSDSDILAGSFLVEIEPSDRSGSGDMMISTAFPLSVKSPGKKVFAPESSDPSDSSSWTDTHNAAKNSNLADYISGYFSLIKNLMKAGDFDAVYKYIDIDSFADYYIINELAKNVDGGMRLSTYLYKDKGGKMHITIWDFDLGYGNCDYGHEFENDPGEAEGFFIREYPWYSYLMNNSAFQNKVRDRWTSLRKGMLSDENIAAAINSEANKINDSAVKNFERWDILGEYVWPNHPTIMECETYEANVEHLINWIHTRANWLDKNL